MRWLHCSDFHIGKDRTAQERLTSKIIEHVAQQISNGFIPDFVFITGDIANSATKSEYKDFRNNFLTPLREALGGNDWDGRIMAVPGNHDTDRSKNNNFDRHAPLAATSRFFDPDKQGKAERDILSPRFKAYRQGAVADLAGDWVSKPEGAFAEALRIRGIKVGIVGINTSWLSKDDGDRFQLTPGIQLVDAALEKVKDCQVCFVLGHHPLNWLHEESTQRLRALFGHHGVIYLHGHMHQADGSREDVAGNEFLVFQSGSAFQARDGEPWENGLMWGKLDLTAKDALLSPRFWNPNNLDWPVKTGRFPENRRVNGSDWWAYPLPNKRITENESKPIAWKQPYGWELLTVKNLKTYQREITIEEGGRFFDGAEPDWTIAQCPKLPRREKVRNLSEQIMSYQSQERPLVILLTGPGGEGKSMTLRQTIVNVLELDGSTNILWHDDDTRQFPFESLANLPEGPWLIATDAADIAAKSLLRLVEGLRKVRRGDIKFLLCSRDTDWRASGAERYEWTRYSDYRIETMSGLSEEDARLIVSSWSVIECGEELSGSLAQEKGLALYEASRTEATNKEGSLLGGILAVRYGAGLRAHVVKLMERLSEYPLETGGSLYDAFAYIATMHSENFDFLSRPVLAKVLNCELRNLGKQVIVPLAKEAAANGGTILLTRHRRIAETAVAIMREEYGEDIVDRFIDLTRAAKESRQNNTFVPELHRWYYELPENFIEHSPEASVRIARVLLDLEADNVKLAVNLARIYRVIGDPADGAELLENFAVDAEAGRIFWCEWSICLGATGDYALNAVFAGWSLADKAASTPPGVKDVKLCLAGMGVAFGELYQNFLDERFVSGRSAAAYLGLQLPFDLTAHGYFEKHKNESESDGATSPVDVEDAVSKLRAGIIAAWEVSGQPQKILLRIIEPEHFAFEGLANLIERQLPSKK